MGTELVDYKEQLGALAEQYVRESATGGSFVTTSGGVLQVGGEPVPGNQLAAVVLDAVRENTYYPDKYDAENPLPPRCYAFGRMSADMGPHPSMQNGPHWFEPQAVQCSACKWNEWGSADTGKGKACHNRKRLALLPAGYFVPKHAKSKDFDLRLFEEPDHYATADIAYLKLPVTSVRGYDKYVQKLAEGRLPPCGAVTRIYVEPDPKSQYVLRFEPITVLPPELLAVVMPRQRLAEEGLMQGYSAPEEAAF